MQIRHITAGFLSLVLVVIGIVLLVKAAAFGSGSAGFAIGALFILAGAGRLYLSRR